MLIGADFFLSHRIYVASSQHRLYFTYNGGPVFNLKASQAPPTTADDSTPAAQSPTEAAAGSSADAAEFARRGTASAARQDYEHAIADLSRACELAPNESSYFYERAIARWQNKQPDLAMADLDRALELKPSDVLALAARAALRLGSRNIAAATADLDAAGRLSAPEADIRLTLAQDYERADLVAPAAAQYDLWIAAHPNDARLATALTGRCWLGATSGEDLDRALSDCNAAVKIIDKSNPDNSRLFDGRGLVRLRMNDFKGSIADYDTALKMRPKNSWALYGRGVDKLRLGKNAEAQADMAAAAALRPSIADDFAKRGIGP
jgi:tetratricopeptide (TPR) repeat protein